MFNEISDPQSQIPIMYRLVVHRCDYLSGRSKSPSPSPVLKKRPDDEEERGVTRCGSPVRLRLPHSPKPADNYQLIPSKAPAMIVSSNNNQTDTKDILPTLCSCLFGLFGCATGLEFCAFVPKICNLLAGLCGSLFNLGASPRQNYSSVTDQVC